MSSHCVGISLSEDVCDIEPEVELISLSFEQLPKYRLTADCNIEFCGYKHNDFTRAEQKRDETTELTNEQIEKTLEYFLLCGLRVNQMTETYEDCAAMRLLVQEQRSHLDLAANIGLNLVEKNNQLEQRVVVLDEQLESSKDMIKQLQHQLHLKDDLLRIFHREIDEAEESNEHLIESASSETIFSLDKINIKKLEDKLSLLEDENRKLRNQQVNLNSNTEILETKEQQLIDECVRQLLDTTKSVDRLSMELNKKTNDYLNQHEEISRLLTTNIDLENKIHQLLTENDRYITQIRDYQTKQFTLTKELSDLRDRYDECINLLNERQDQIRLLKKKQSRDLLKHIHIYSPPSPEPSSAQSLATELEECCRRETLQQEQSRTLRMMEQVRSINSVNWLDGDDDTSGFNDDMGSSFITTASDTATVTDTMAESTGNYLLRRSIQEDCEKRRVVRPKRDDLSSEVIESSPVAFRKFSSGVAADYAAEAFKHRQSSCQGINSLNTTLMGSDPSTISSQSVYRLPDKLQLVKPMAGSQTLKAWQNLATPSLTKALFENQPQGVCFRGQQPLLTCSPTSSDGDQFNIGDKVFGDESSVMSSDLDDVDSTIYEIGEYFDDSEPTTQSKNYHCSSTLTYSTSRMLHTNGNGTQAAIDSSDCLTTIHRPFIRKPDSTTTFSLNLGLAAALQERDVDRSIVQRSDDTPVNEQDPNSVFRPRQSYMMHTGIDQSAVQPPSWLDRLTVGSIMNSILGYSKPINRVSTSYASPSHKVVSRPVEMEISSSPESKLIGRLTKLPPLAISRRSKAQSGLNVLSSDAPPTPIIAVIHRIGNIARTSESDDSSNHSDSPRSSVSQLD